MILLLDYCAILCYIDDTFSRAFLHSRIARENVSSVQHTTTQTPSGYCKVLIFVRPCAVLSDGTLGPSQIVGTLQ